ncbi:MAG: retroviral-like aspartic protease [Planctomycetes bacterium]|nr:retroviral-like aspartic protease [Planctomycetota bacterium]
MGLITKELTIIGTKGRRRVTALFDTGSTYTLIRESIASQIGEPMEMPEPKKFVTAVGDFRADRYLGTDVVLGRKRLFASAIAAPGLTEDFIVGTDFMQVWHIRLDPKRHRIILDPKAFKLKAVGARHRP